uniref:Cell division protein n=1 Tax=Chlamydomonas nivalis TaxID=47906 RepID=A0A0S2IBS6_9CHLO|nr:cell division protein [Chlamydomonas nivalis]
MPHRKTFICYWLLPFIGFLSLIPYSKKNINLMNFGTLEGKPFESKSNSLKSYSLLTKNLPRMPLALNFLQKISQSKFINLTTMGQIHAKALLTAEFKPLLTNNLTNFEYSNLFLNQKGQVSKTANNHIKKKLTTSKKNSKDNNIQKLCFVYSEQFSHAIDKINNVNARLGVHSLITPILKKEQVSKEGHKLYLKKFLNFNFSLVRNTPTFEWYFYSFNPYFIYKLNSLEQPYKLKKNLKVKTNVLKQNLIKNLVVARKATFLWAKPLKNIYKNKSINSVDKLHIIDEASNLINFGPKKLIPIVKKNKMSLFFMFNDVPILSYQKAFLLLENILKNQILKNENSFLTINKSYSRYLLTLPSFTTGLSHPQNSANSIENKHKIERKRNETPFNTLLSPLRFMSRGSGKGIAKKEGVDVPTPSLLLMKQKKTSNEKNPLFFSQKNLITSYKDRFKVKNKQATLSNVTQNFLLKKSKFLNQSMDKTYKVELLAKQIKTAYNKIIKSKQNASFVPFFLEKIINAQKSYYHKTITLKSLNRSLKKITSLTLLNEVLVNVHNKNMNSKTNSVNLGKIYTNAYLYKQNLTFLSALNFKTTNFSFKASKYSLPFASSASNFSYTNPKHPKGTSTFGVSVTKVSSKDAEHQKTVLLNIILKKNCFFSNLKKTIKNVLQAKLSHQARLIRVNKNSQVLLKKQNLFNKTYLENLLNELFIFRNLLTLKNSNFKILSLSFKKSLLSETLLNRQSILLDQIYPLWQNKPFLKLNKTKKIKNTLLISKKIKKDSNQTFRIVKNAFNYTKHKLKNQTLFMLRIKNRKVRLLEHKQEGRLGASSIPPSVFSLPQHSSGIVEGPTPLRFMSKEAVGLVKLKLAARKYKYTSFNPTPTATQDQSKVAPIILGIGTQKKLELSFFWEASNNNKVSTLLAAKQMALSGNNKLLDNHYIAWLKKQLCPLLEMPKAEWRSHKEEAPIHPPLVERSVALLESGWNKINPWVNLKALRTLDETLISKEIKNKTNFKFLSIFNLKSYKSFYKYKYWFSSFFLSNLGTHFQMNFDKANIKLLKHFNVKDSTTKEIPKIMKMHYPIIKSYSEVKNKKNLKDGFLAYSPYLPNKKTRQISLDKAKNLVPNQKKQILFFNKNQYLISSLFLNPFPYKREQNFKKTSNFPRVLNGKGLLDTSNPLITKVNSITKHLWLSISKKPLKLLGKKRINSSLRRHTKKSLFSDKKFKAKLNSILTLTKNSFLDKIVYTNNKLPLLGFSKEKLLVQLNSNTDVRQFSTLNKELGARTPNKMSNNGTAGGVHPLASSAAYGCEAEHPSTFGRKDAEHTKGVRSRGRSVAAVQDEQGVKAPTLFAREPYPSKAYSAIKYAPHEDLWPLIVLKEKLKLKTNIIKKLKNIKGILFVGSVTKLKGQIKGIFHMPFKKGLQSNPFLTFSSLKKINNGKNFQLRLNSTSYVALKPLSEASVTNNFYPLYINQRAKIDQALFRNLLSQSFVGSATQRNQATLKALPSEELALKKKYKNILRFHNLSNRLKIKYHLFKYLKKYIKFKKALTSNCDLKKETSNFNFRLRLKNNPEDNGLLKNLASSARFNINSFNQDKAFSIPSTKGGCKINTNILPFYNLMELNYKIKNKNFIYSFDLEKKKRIQPIFLSQAFKSGGSKAALNLKFTKLILLMKNQTPNKNKSRLFYASHSFAPDFKGDGNKIKKNLQKKRRALKQRRKTSRLLKRKRFFPRPIWLRLTMYKKFLKLRHNTLNHSPKGYQLTTLLLERNSKKTALNFLMARQYRSGKNQENSPTLKKIISKMTQPIIANTYLKTDFKQKSQSLEKLSLPVFQTLLRMGHATYVLPPTERNKNTMEKHSLGVPSLYPSIAYIQKNQIKWNSGSIYNKQKNSIKTLNMSLYYSIPHNPSLLSASLVSNFSERPLGSSQSLDIPSAFSKLRYPFPLGPQTKRAPTEPFYKQKWMGFSEEHSKQGKKGYAMHALFDSLRRTGQRESGLLPFAPIVATNRSNIKQETKTIFNEKEFYSISKHVLTDFKQGLWKSSWLRANLNAYLNKIKQSFNVMKTIAQTSEFKLSFISKIDKINPWVNLKVLRTLEVNLKLGGTRNLIVSKKMPTTNKLTNNWVFPLSPTSIKHNFHLLTNIFSKTIRTTNYNTFKQEPYTSVAYVPTLSQNLLKWETSLKKALFSKATFEAKLEQIITNIKYNLAASYGASGASYSHLAVLSHPSTFGGKDATRSISSIHIPNLKEKEQEREREKKRQIWNNACKKLKKPIIKDFSFLNYYGTAINQKQSQSTNFAGGGLEGAGQSHEQNLNYSFQGGTLFTIQDFSNISKQKIYWAINKTNMWLYKNRNKKKFLWANQKQREQNRSNKTKNLFSKAKALITQPLQVKYSFETNKNVKLYLNQVNLVKVKLNKKIDHLQNNLTNEKQNNLGQSPTLLYSMTTLSKDKNPKKLIRTKAEQTSVSNNSLVETSLKNKLVLSSPFVRIKLKVQSTFKKGLCPFRNLSQLNNVFYNHSYNLFLTKQKQKENKMNYLGFLDSSLPAKSFLQKNFSQTLKRGWGGNNVALFLFSYNYKNTIGDANKLHSHQASLEGLKNQFLKFSKKQTEFSSKVHLSNKIKWSPGPLKPTLNSLKNAQVLINFLENFKTPERSSRQASLLKNSWFEKNGILKEHKIFLRHLKNSLRLIYKQNLLLTNSFSNTQISVPYPGSPLSHSQKYASHKKDAYTKHKKEAALNLEAYKKKLLKNQKKKRILKEKLNYYYSYTSLYNLQKKANGFLSGKSYMKHRAQATLIEKRLNSLRYPRHGQTLANPFNSSLAACSANSEINKISLLNIFNPFIFSANTVKLHLLNFNISFKDTTKQSLIYLSFLMCTMIFHLCSFAALISSAEIRSVIKFFIIFSLKLTYLYIGLTRSIFSYFLSFAKVFNIQATMNSRQTTVSRLSKAKLAHPSIPLLQNKNKMLRKTQEERVQLKIRGFNQGENIEAKGIASKQQNRPYNMILKVDSITCFRKNNQTNFVKTNFSGPKLTSFFKNQWLGFNYQASLEKTSIFLASSIFYAVPLDLNIAKAKNKEIKIFSKQSLTKNFLLKQTWKKNHFNYNFNQSLLRNLLKIEGKKLKFINIQNFYQRTYSNFNLFNTSGTRSLFNLIKNQKQAKLNNNKLFTFQNSSLTSFIQTFIKNLKAKLINFPLIKNSFVSPNRTFKPYLSYRYKLPQKTLFDHATHTSFSKEVCYAYFPSSYATLLPSPSPQLRLLRGCYSYASIGCLWWKGKDRKDPYSKLCYRYSYPLFTLRGKKRKSDFTILQNRPYNIILKVDSITCFRMDSKQEPFSSIQNRLIFFKQKKINKNLTKAIISFKQQITKIKGNKQIKVKIISLKLLKGLIKLGVNVSYSCYTLFVKAVEIPKTGIQSIYIFFEKPGELLSDWITHLFLIEIASDLTTIIPENTDAAIWNSFTKFAKSSSLPILIPILAALLEKRLFSVAFETFLELLSQPDTDLIIRQKKVSYAWDIWATELKKTAEKNNINISLLTSKKEDQAFLIAKLLEDNQISADRNIKHIWTQFFSKTTKNQIDQEKGHKIIFDKKKSLVNFNTLHPILRSFFFKNGWDEVGASITDRKQNKLIDLLSVTKVNMPIVEQKKNIKNLIWKRWSANQFMTYKGKDSDLFIQAPPAPKSFQVSFKTIKHYNPIQAPVGNIICQIYSGIFYKKTAKNFLIVGTSSNNSNYDEKSLLIQSLAGETEMKIIKDNANRYNFTLGIKSLRNVFDALALHTPCIFLIEDIHVIGERRPMLVGDDENAVEANSKSGTDPHQTQLNDEKNLSIAKLTRHVVMHYKKPFRGDYSYLIPTRLRLFDLFLGVSSPRTRQKGLTPLSPIFLEKENQTQALSKSIVSVKASTLQLSIASPPTNFNESMPSFKKKKEARSLAPPSTTPFTVSLLKEQTKFQPKNTVKEVPWIGLPEQSNQLRLKQNYSIRVKIALLAHLAVSNLSLKLNMITDLLVIIDSVRANRGFVVFATTHTPAILDPALRRPGRLDETIALPFIPKLENRWEIVKSSVIGLNSSASFFAFSSNKYFFQGIPESGFPFGLTVDLLDYGLFNDSLSTLNLQSFKIQEKLIRFKKNQFKLKVLCTFSSLKSHLFLKPPRLNETFILDNILEPSRLLTVPDSSNSVYSQKAKLSSLPFSSSSVLATHPINVVAKDGDQAPSIPFYAASYGCTFKKEARDPYPKQEHAFSYTKLQREKSRSKETTEVRNAANSIFRKKKTYKSKIEMPKFPTRSALIKNKISLVKNGPSTLVAIAYSKIGKLLINNKFALNYNSVRLFSTLHSPLENLNSHKQQNSPYLHLYTKQENIKQILISMLTAKVTETFAFSALSLNMAKSFYSKQPDQKKFSNKGTKLPQLSLPITIPHPPKVCSATLTHPPKVGYAEVYAKMDGAWDPYILPPSPKGKEPNKDKMLGTPLPLQFMSRGSVGRIASTEADPILRMPKKIAEIGTSTVPVFGLWSLQSIDKTWRAASSIIFSYIDKQLIYKKNLVIPKLLQFYNAGIQSSALQDPPSAPSSLVLLPAKRYENYKRSFLAMQNQNAAYELKAKPKTAFVGAGSPYQKIELHQKRILKKKLYSLLAVNKSLAPSFPSLLGIDEHQKLDETEQQNNTLTNPKKKESYAKLTIMGKQSLMGNQVLQTETFNLANEAFATLLSVGKFIEKPTSINWYYRNRLLNRHLASLNNQWWNGQLSEHNVETTFLSDVDWRSNFVASFIGKGSHFQTNKKELKLSSFNINNSNQTPTHTISKRNDVTLFEEEKVANKDKRSLSKETKNDDKRINSEEVWTKKIEESSLLDVLIDYPDFDQHYNPRNRRWILNFGYWSYWYHYQKDHNNEIYSYIIMETFLQTYHFLNSNREILDYLVTKFIKLGLLKEITLIDSLKRF